MIHIGSFDDESTSFAQMETYVKDHGFLRVDKTHREIYLSDPRKTDVGKMKTVYALTLRKLINFWCDDDARGRHVQLYF